MSTANRPCANCGEIGEPHAYDCPLNHANVLPILAAGYRHGLDGKPVNGYADSLEKCHAELMEWRATIPAPRGSQPSGGCPL